MRPSSHTRPNATPWGYQKSARFSVGEGAPQTLITLEQCMGLSHFPGYALEHPEGVPARPVGLWRVSCSMVSGADLFVASLTYGTGGDTRRLRRVVLPLVAYVPGYCQVDIEPFDAVQEPAVITATVVPVQSYTLQQVGTLEDATAGAVDIPDTAFGLTFQADSVYRMLPLGVNIAAPAGTTVDIAGRVSLISGVAVAWHEL